MGLFSPKRITQVATQVSPLIKPEEEVQNETTAAIIRSIFEDISLTDALTESVMSGARMKTERMYDYAKKSKTVGLPEGRFIQRDGNTSGMQSVLNALEDKPVNLVYAFLGEINNVHVGYQKLINNYDFNLDTGEIEALSQQKGSPVYLKNINPVHAYSRRMNNEELQKDPLQKRFSEAKSIDFMDNKLGEDFSQVVNKGLPEFTSQDNEMCRVSYWFEVEVVDQEEEKDDEGNVVKRRLTHMERRNQNILMGVGFDASKDYHQALYTTGSGSSKRWHTFTYEDGLGTYPQLDGNMAELFKDGGDYFPFIPFRMAKEDVRKTRGKAEVDEYRKMVKLIGNDYDEMSDLVHDNPDINDIEQALFVFGVNMHTKEPACIEYLYRFFDRLFRTRHLRDKNEIKHYNEAIEKFTIDGNSQALVIKEKEKKISFNYRTLTKVMIEKEGKKGEYRSKIENRTISYQYAKRIKVGRGNDYDYEYKTAQRDIPVLVLENQLGESFCERIEVANPITLFYVYNHHMTGATLNTEKDDGSDKSIIPLEKSIVDEMSLQARDIVYKRAPRFVFNARTVTRLKWYQSSVFQFVVTVIALFVAATTGQAWLAKLVAATATAAAKMILLALIKTYAIRKASELVVKELGAEAAIVAAVVLAVISAGKSLKAGSVEGAPFVSELMMASNGLSDAVSSYYQDKIGEYQTKNQEFNLMAEEKMEELQDIQEALDVHTLLDPFTLLKGRQPLNILGEDPESFYNRTVNSGNVGVYAFDANENFVENSLRLPSINDTLGGTL